MFSVILKYRKRYYFFPKLDFKLKGWISALNTEDFEIFLRKEGILFYLTAIRAIISLKSIFIFRYLNVQNNLILEILKATFFLPLFLLGYFRIIKINWIMHNVDKETHERWPFIVKYYRKSLFIITNKVYVTSPQYISAIPTNSFKRSPITEVIAFGDNYEITRDTDLQLVEKIKDFKLELSKKSENIKVGLCVAFSSKNKRTELSISHLIKKYKGKIAFVVFSDLFDLSSEEFILQIKKRQFFREEDLLDSIDFTFKEMDDISIPYSMYSAAYAGLPMFTSTKSPFHLELDYWGIGSSLDGVSDLLRLLEEDRSNNYRRFRLSMNWLNGAKVLFDV